MSERKRTVVAATIALSLIAVGAAFADNDRRATDQELGRVRTALEAQGYREVHDLEVDDGQFEVDATHAQGYPVDLELDLETLEILHADRD